MTWLVNELRRTHGSESKAVIEREVQRQLLEMWQSASPEVIDDIVRQIMTVDAEDPAFQDGGRFRIERVPYAPERYISIGQGAFGILGGQSEWYWGVPGVFRALASPWAWIPVPAHPARSEYANLTSTLGYWTALNVLMRYRLGWRRPAEGLMRWYDMGKPVDDDTLALIAEVWAADGELDDYLAWLLEGQAEVLASTHTYTPQLSPKWTQWLRDYNARPDRNTVVGGPGDSLHLKDHIAQSHAADADKTCAVLSLQPPRAIFQTSAMDAWYWELRDYIRSLPPHARSWRVDAYVRPTGFLGTYRLSTQTGLIFTGRHRYHQMGN
jgi:hypothetical protein